VSRPLAQPVRQIVQKRLVLVLGDEFDGAIAAIPDFPGETQFLGYPLYERTESYSLNPTPYNEPLRWHGRGLPRGG
jgi:hypothetical protein